MFGVTFFELMSIIKQLGLALAGASCLWGVYFFFQQRGVEGDRRGVLKETSCEMMTALTVGVFLTAVSWVAIDFYHSFSVLAHEGITLVPEVEAVREAVDLLTPVFFLFILIYLAGVFYRKYDEERFHERMVWFYGVELFLAAVLISFPVWLGLNQEQLFFFGHSFHSVLTVGTVLILDYLFLLTMRSELHEKFIYPHFHNVSKVIWLGLAIDFLSVAFIFNDAVANTPKLKFMQTVIGVIIINGVFLSGPVVKYLIQSVEDETIQVIRPLDNHLLSLSGSISVASWITVTAVDLVKNIQLGYLELFMLYLGFIAVVFFVSRKLKHHEVGSRWG